MAKFSKGQQVTFFQDWDSKGTFRFVDLVVHSAGAKRMVLVDANGEKFEGANFLPAVQQLCRFNEVRPRMSAGDAEAHALTLAAAFIAFEHAEVDALIARNGDALGARYISGMRARVERLHEPRAVTA